MLVVAAAKRPLQQRLLAPSASRSQSRAAIRVPAPRKPCDQNKTALSLDVLNLLDFHYFDIVYEQDYRVMPTAPMVPNGITVHPGEPCEVRLTLRLTL